MSNILFVTVILLFVFGYFGVMLNIGFLDAKRNFGSSVARYETRWFALWLVAVFAIILLLYFVVPRSARDSLYAILSLAVAGMVWGQVILAARRQRGAQTLLNLGRIERRALVYVGVLFIIMVAYPVSDIIQGTVSGMPVIAQIVFIFLQGVFSIAMGISAVAVTDRGIRRFAHYIQWQQVEGYRWEADKEHVLTLKLQKRPPFFVAQTSLRIPEDKKQNVNQLIEKHVSSAL